MEEIKASSMVPSSGEAGKKSSSRTPAIASVSSNASRNTGYHATRVTASSAASSHDRKGTEPGTSAKNLSEGAQNGGQEEEEIVVEQPLSHIREVFVYRVPPLRASSGHRAEEWGLENPVFTGSMKMVQVGNSCCLRLYRPPPEGVLGASPELFAQCEVRLENGRTVPFYVESVIDSSRYFVLRCEDKASRRHAYVGIGFRERSMAFDMKAVLDDFVRFMDRQKRAAESAAAERRDEEEGGGSDEAGAVVKPLKDLSIADGQKLHLEFKAGSRDSGGRVRPRPRSSADKSMAGAGSKMKLLAPPPLPGATYKAAGVVSKAADPASQQGGGVSTEHAEVAAREEGKESAVGSQTEERELHGTAEAGPGEGGGGVSPGKDGGNEEDEDDAWGEFESA